VVKILQERKAAEVFKSLVQPTIKISSTIRIPSTMAVSLIVQKIREFVLFLQLCLIFVIGNTLLLRLSYAKRITVAIMHKAAGVTLPEDMYWNSLFTQAMMKALWDHHRLDMRRAARHGQKAPDPLLVDPSTGEEKQLLKAVDVQRLQVLAFGSYSCPVFRLKFKELQSLAKEFHSVADFSVIYINEAHPSDGWAFKVRFCTHLIGVDRWKSDGGGGGGRHFQLFGRLLVLAFLHSGCYMCLSLL
jgi:hypothetical protein